MERVSVRDVINGESECERCEKWRVSVRDVRNGESECERCDIWRVSMRNGESE